MAVHRITSSPGGVRRIAIFASVCLSVCLSARISQNDVSIYFIKNLNILPVAVARSSSEDNTTRHVLPVCR